MNFPKINRPSLMVFLSITIGVIESFRPDASIQQQSQPYWQYVLREFVFKAVSQPVPDDTLYKKLLAAPFYGGPLAEPSNDENALLSRGSVYRMPDEQWILCQDDCEKCELCAKQKYPTVKWALRRVRRWTGEGLPKWDLRLTVVPRSHRWPDNYAYVVREDEPEPADSHVAITTDRAIVYEKDREKNVPDTSGGKHRTHLSEMERVNDRTDQLSRGNGGSNGDSTVRAREHRQDDSRKMRSRNLARAKRHRSKVRPIGRPGPLAFYYGPREELPRINSPTDRIRDDASLRLIMGIDQHGEKHLVHVVPIYSAPQNQVQSGYPWSHRESYGAVNSPRISRTIQPGSDQPNYEKLIDRILDSLSTHRAFIETFMFSERLEPETPKQSVISPYSSYTGRINEDERFPSRNNDANYRGRSSQRASRYPIDSEYQVDEQQDEQYARYGDMTKGLNRPGGVYQDQSSMMEYEPYRMSANGQRHDERSLPQADAERRRRNPFGKPTRSSSTFEHQGIGGNHTIVDNVDSEFTVKRKLVIENSIDRGLGIPRVDINQTDPGRQNKLSVESSTVRTGELGDSL